MGEVNTGFGRCGPTCWGYQLYQDVIPDIIILGKMVANGFPMGVLVTSEKVAQSFPSTHDISQYTGNSTSCSIATALLDVLKREKLMESALQIGKLLLEVSNN